MADNYSENKNNILFVFLAEMVHRGWFDTIEMYFGPVGHTHNGCDAVHYVHNQIAGNNTCLTLADLWATFPSAWHDEHKRPQPVVLDQLYDWVSHYSQCSRPVSFFTRTPTQQSYVRAFKFAKRNGRVEMRIKGDPTHPIWCGDKGIETADGLYVLNNVPLRVPEVLPPQHCSLEPRLVADINSVATRKVCESYNMMANHAWLLQWATTGVIPLMNEGCRSSHGGVWELTGGCDTSHGPPPTRTSRYRTMLGWRQLEWVGVPNGSQCHVPFLRVDPSIKTDMSLWKFPEECRPFEIPARVRPQCPPCTYTDTAHRNKKPKPATVERKQKSATEPADEEWEEDEDSEKECKVRLIVPGAPVKNWGANVSDCRRGMFACYQAEWPERAGSKKFLKGIGVVQVFFSSCTRKKWVWELPHGVC